MTFQNPKKASSYGGLLWFQKILAISVDFPDFKENKSRFNAFFGHIMKRKAKKRLKLTKNYVICQTKRHHLGQYYSRIALNPHEEAKAGENDKFFFWKRNWINHENPFIFQIKSEIIVGRHNLTFQAQKKASSYGRIVKLWPSSYGRRYCMESFNLLLIASEK